MPVFSLQMTVFARDYGTPRLQSQVSASVTINVIRNRNCPVFQNAPYSAGISQNVATGTSVFQVTATDADAVSTIYDRPSIIL